MKKVPTMPSISVVMPVYNVAEFVAVAIRSVLDQTMADFEMIIVDDCSPDNSIEICESFQDPRIRIVRHQQNRGLAGARNTGIHAARAPLIAFLDSDDFWHPEKLDKHLQHLNQRASVGISFSRSAFVDRWGMPLRCYQMPLLSGITPDHLFCRNPVGNGSAPVVRREVFDAIGYQAEFRGEPEIRYFDSELRRSEDIECWLRISLQTNWSIEGIPEPLTFYRLNEGGLSSNLHKQLESWEEVVEKTCRYSPQFVERHYRTARAYQLRYLSRQAIRLGDGETAMRFLQRAFAADKRMLTQEPARTLCTAGAAFLLRLLPRGYRLIEWQALQIIGLLQKRRIQRDIKTV